MKTWLEALVGAYKIDGKTRKGGLVVWSSSILKAKTIRFTDKKTAAQLKRVIEKLPRPSGGTNGKLALDYTYKNLFGKGSNPKTRREIIFISDGVSSTPLAKMAKQVYINLVDTFTTVEKDLMKDDDVIAYRYSFGMFF